MAYVFSILSALIGGALLAWILCERGSDMATPRWADGWRLLSFIFKAFISLFMLLGLPDYLSGAPFSRTSTFAVAMLFGLSCGFFSYFIYRRFISPRPAERGDETTSNTVLKANRPFKRRRLSWQEWLVLDFAVLKEHFKNNRAKKSDSNKPKK